MVLYCLIQNFGLQVGKTNETNTNTSMTLVDGEPTSATIRTGQFDNTSPTAGTLIETRDF